MSLLTNLPTELIDCVVANIESRHTLCNLARCSRRLYLCAVPYLYRHVTIKDESGLLIEMPNTQLLHIASLLLPRPDLAWLVRHFTLESAQRSDLTEDSSEGYADSGSLEELEELEDADSGYFEDLGDYADPEDFDELEESAQGSKTAIKSLSLYDEEKFERLRTLGHAPNDDDDLILALLLSALPRVEKVVLDLRSHHDTKHLEWMIGRTASRSRPFDGRPLFESLTYFGLSCDRVDVQSRGLMASLLKLPALQVISGCFGDAWDDSFGEMKAADKNLIGLESASSPIIGLNLVASALRKADLGHIFRAPKALRTLWYEFCPFTINPIKNLRHALRHQEKCLENLAFDYDEAYENIHGFWRTLGVHRNFGPMSSFKSFNNLKVFKTAALFLLRTENGTDFDNLIDLFPASLETLHLTRLVSCFPEVLVALEHLIAQKSPQQIPSLKTLILEESECHCLNSETLMDLSWKQTEEKALDRLVTVCVAQNVSLLCYCLGGIE